MSVLYVKLGVHAELSVLYVIMSSCTLRKAKYMFKAARCLKQLELLLLSLSVFYVWTPCRKSKLELKLELLRLYVGLECTLH